MQEEAGCRSSPTASTDGNCSSRRSWPRPRGSIPRGLVTTKRSELESQDELQRRTDAAARFVPLERLALSTQCGFASTFEGNEITPEAQRAKLELIVRTAEKVWGHA